MAKPRAKQLTTIQSIENVRQGLTLSGLSVYAIERLAAVDGYLEAYASSFWDYFYDTYGRKDMESALGQSLEAVQDMPGIGDFIADAGEQLAALAAFGLVQIDRLAQQAADGRSGWEALWVYDQVAECHSYVHHQKLSASMPVGKRIAEDAISKANRRAAHARHMRDPKQAAKAEILTRWKAWKQLPTKYRNTTQFARAMLDEYPDTLESEVVITRWVREWQKQFN